jgi:hypothetical protein
MQNNKNLDWDVFAVALRSMATEKFETSSNLLSRCNLAGAAQERMIADMLLCIATAVDAAKPCASLRREIRSQ